MALTDHLTIADAANLEQKSLRKGVLQAFYEDLLPNPADRIPWAGVNSLRQTVVSLSQVDTPSLRNINEPPTVWKAQFEQFEETLKTIENTITIDPVLLMVKDYVQDLRISQVKAYMKQVNYLINDLLINGNPSVDERQPAGLEYRLENSARFVGQTVHAGVTTTPLNVDADEASRLKWLNKINETFSKIDGENPTIIVANVQTRLMFWAVLMAQKLLDVTKDQQDREILRYRGVPLTDPGQKPAGSLVGGAATQVLGDDDETSPIGAATSSTSMYLIKFGEDYFTGLQLGGGLDVKHFGESVANTEQDKTRIRWVCGFGIFHPRSVARLCGLDIS